jgi:hypothetical protein
VAAVMCVQAQRSAWASASLLRQATAVPLPAGNKPASAPREVRVAASSMLRRASCSSLLSKASGAGSHPPGQACAAGMACCRRSTFWGLAAVAAAAAEPATACRVAGWSRSYRSAQHSVDT